MPGLRLQLHNARRLTAWLLLLICLWMGSGGVLHHTDAEAPVCAASHGPSGLHRLAATTPADTCAACEWTQGLQTGSFSVCRVQPPFCPLCSHSQAAPRASVGRVLRPHSPRGPPAFLLNA